MTTPLSISAAAWSQCLTPDAEAQQSKLCSSAGFHKSILLNPVNILSDNIDVAIAAPIE